METNREDYNAITTMFVDTFITFITNESWKQIEKIITMCVEHNNESWKQIEKIIMHITTMETNREDYNAITTMSLSTHS